jgi:Na+/H+ antiporter NhaA
VFLLTLTVFDDIAAVTIIGLVYSDALDFVALAVAAGCLAALAVLSRRDEWRNSLYVALWVATVESGLHPSIAGMLGGLLIAARPRQRRDVERAASLFRAFRQSPLPDVGYSARKGLQRSVSANERFRTVLHPWTSYVIVPVFALANAGVDLRGPARRRARLPGHPGRRRRACRRQARRDRARRARRPAAQGRQPPTGRRPRTGARGRGALGHRLHGVAADREPGL